MPVGNATKLRSRAIVLNPLAAGEVSCLTRIAWPSCLCGRGNSLRRSRGTVAVFAGGLRAPRARLMGLNIPSRPATRAAHFAHYKRFGGLVGNKNSASCGGNALDAIPRYRFSRRGAGRGQFAAAVSSVRPQKKPRRGPKIPRCTARPLSLRWRLRSATETTRAGWQPAHGPIELDSDCRKSRGPRTV